MPLGNVAQEGIHGVCKGNEGHPHGQPFFGAVLRVAGGDRAPGRVALESRKTALRETLDE